MIRKFFYSVVMFLVAFLPVRGAEAYIINFEDLPDSTALTSQYSGLGVTFTGATVLTSGISLNEFEFPPHSGTNVVFDDGGPMTLDFSAPVSSIGGYFTYLTPLTLTAYDALDVVVTTAASFFDNNTALSGDPGSLPNEFLQVASTSAFRGLTSPVTLWGARSPWMTSRWPCPSPAPLCSWPWGLRA